MRPVGNMSEQLEDLASVAMLKRVHRQHRRTQRRARRRTRWGEIRCFWTWPLGHEYVASDEARTVFTCVGCGRNR